ncbi:Protein-export membrane protein SecF [uncultured archaeon]|nr:Protein-export membrane protein SecF [uncultured archaeon]
MKKKMKNKLNAFYNKHYQLSLIFPAVVLILSLIFIGHNYFSHGDILNRDVSLTGGTSITFASNLPVEDVQKALSSSISDVEVRSLSDNTGIQTHLSVITSQNLDTIKPILEKYLGYSLTDQNSTIESTGSSLSKDFYKQLLIAVLIAFFWMAAVVFIIYASKRSAKVWAIIINLLLGFFMGSFFFNLPIILSIIILVAIAGYLIYIYIKHSVPSFAVMLCAFLDVIMTLAVVDLTGMKISAAGIVAFLMLIGYSVDTDILLTTRVLKRHGTSVNHEIFGAFKTGMTMTLTALASVAVALIFVYSYKTSLNQIFEILLIGLFFDIFNTWITNTALIKWFVERDSFK